ncbi:MAG: T9SS type A sorting domain-containing protein [Bizionia sp.]|nr:T9SS type A sorting domain-containing protein [Bizionia sp.]
MKRKLLFAILLVIVVPLFAQNDGLGLTPQELGRIELNEMSKASIINEQGVFLNTLAPSGDSNQSFCIAAAATLNDVVVIGENIKWYDASALGNTLPLSTSVMDNTSYFASQTVDGEESNSRLEVLVMLLADDDASFNYSRASYCKTAYDPSPAITGLTGGTFTSSPVGLVIDSSTGLVDVSASSANTYNITYTTNGDCSNSSTVSLTVNEIDDASFSYSSPSYCVTDVDPIPTVTGEPGGIFTSSPSGLVFDSSSGSVDVSSSVANTYTITYITNGDCINSSSVSLTINNLDDAGFSYSASAFCVTDSDPSPTITGLAGGSFTSSPSGLVLDANTGLVDVSASTANTYTVTYTTNGDCANSFSATLTVSLASLAPTGVSPQTFSSDTNPTFADVVVTGDNLQWYDAIMGGNSISMSTGLSDGFYYVSQTPTGACESDRLEVEIIINTLSVETFTESVFSIYPNPNNGQFIISFSRSLKNPKVQVFDIHGRLVFEQVNSASKQKIDVSSSVLEEGVYIVRVTTESTIIDKKIIIRK